MDINPSVLESDRKNGIWEGKGERVEEGENSLCAQNLANRSSNSNNKIRLSWQYQQLFISVGKERSSFNLKALNLKAETQLPLHQKKSQNTKHSVGGEKKNDHRKNKHDCRKYHVLQVSHNVFQGLKWTRISLSRQKKSTK